MPDRLMKEDIDKAVYASMLYDFYGSLLSDSQNEVTALYHEDNLSLAEIAEQIGQSRQAVHYTLKKAEKALGEYEEKLGLVAAYERHQKLAAEALEIVERSGLSEDAANPLKRIIERLSE